VSRAVLFELLLHPCHNNNNTNAICVVLVYRLLIYRLYALFTNAPMLLHPLR
jgi:hypothetical protein